MKNRLTIVSEDEEGAPKLSLCWRVKDESRNCGYLRESRQSGATIVEFAIVSLLCMLLTGAIIDFGIFMFRFAMINYGLSRATRAVAITRDQVSDCGYLSVSEGVPGLAQQVKENFQNVQLKTLGVDANVEFHGRGFSPPSGEGPPYWLDIQAEWLPVCFFCSALFRGQRVPLSSQAILENRDSC